MHTHAREQTHFVQMSPALRRRLEATLDSLVDLLDALDASEEDLEDGADCEFDPAEDGIADGDGLIEQTVGEPSLGATVDFDQRRAWRDSGAFVLDGEAPETVRRSGRLSP